MRREGFEFEIGPPKVRNFLVTHLTARTKCPHLAYKFWGSSRGLALAMNSQAATPSGTDAVARGVQMSTWLPAVHGHSRTPGHAPGLAKGRNCAAASLSVGMWRGMQ